ncbi:MAG: hypothetical protein HY756_07980 [Nitrospirae bacterium]|nr:hypothetical protein [Nitrospirota bacterium]
MSGSKCSPPVEVGGGAGGSIVAIPLVLAGLAAVGIAKGIQKGYKTVKKIRAETSKSEMNAWLADMKMPMSLGEKLKLPPKMSVEGINKDAEIFSTEINGVRLDNVFIQLQKMANTSKKSGIWVNDYTMENINRVVVMGMDNSDNRIAFTKDQDGKYQAFGAVNSKEALSKNINNIMCTFYKNSLYYQLHEWGLKNVQMKANANSYNLMADNSGMSVKINKQNGQIHFENIPENLQAKVEKWLKTFTGECRVTQSPLKSAKTGRKQRGAVSA